MKNIVYLMLISCSINAMDEPIYDTNGLTPSELELAHQVVDPLSDVYAVGLIKKGKIYTITHNKEQQEYRILFYRPDRTIYESRCIPNSKLKLTIYIKHSIPQTKRILFIKPEFQ